ncbi:NAPDH-dependent diflavin reductase [Gnomoniopsis smithogilvyi]|uniref:NADPH-dependent diflavin oxidoreductase 1 n=1 Tax=Gnomoniopsis smithogilvyi TaxID=1191159 RepID=A0A9W8YR58_9PEZI|nr:NAPDH-dependent diflavin reductase [Gnomoniopsis smithogilvyi]
MEEEERTALPSEQELKGRSLLVLYGTETGHSKEIAEEIVEAAERLRFRTSIEQMNDVSLKEVVQHSITVFVTSTTGQGDIPANASLFWKSLLRKKLSPSCLSQLHFTTFGLGDSSYPKFNWAARKLQKRLLQLGAVEVYASGEGDERHDNGIDSIYLPWFQGLKSHLSDNFPLPANVKAIPDDELLPPKYPIMFSLENRAVLAQQHAALSHVFKPKSLNEELDDQERRLHDLRGLGRYAREGGTISDRLTGADIAGADHVRLDNDNILKDYSLCYDMEDSDEQADGPHKKRFRPIPDTWDAEIVQNERVTPANHWQDVRRLEISIYENDWNDELPTLRPGDTLTIYPKNFPAEVDKLIEMMDWTGYANKRIVWSNQEGRPDYPRDLYPVRNATLRDLLLHNLDINAIPNRTFLKQLRRHTNDDREKERLQELTQEDNTQEFYDYTSRPRRTILEVLEDFPAVKLPFNYALEIFPVIRGRAFSIANSAASHHDDKSTEHVVELLVALVQYKTIIRKPRQGLCSRYIKSLAKGSRLAVGLSRNHAPPTREPNSRRPLIAIATGTGIAPVRSVLQERRMWKSTKGPELLFFGCRSKHADFYFQDEWSKDSTLRVIPAFSRDPIDPGDTVGLDPYADKEKRLVDSDKTLSTDLAAMGPRDAPWLRSTDYDRGKMYVQHQIRRHAEEVCEIVKQAMSKDSQPIIMICGNAGRMPISVRHALEDALVLGGLVNDHEKARKALQEIGIWMETW